MSGQYDIVIVDHGVMRALEKLSAGPRKRAERKGTQVAAKYLKPKVKAEAPVGRGPRSERSTSMAKGAVRKSVKIGPAKRDKPGYTVRVTNGLRHVVIRGSKPRFTRKTHAYRGIMPGNPFVTRAADANQEEALNLALKAIAEALGL
jgi:Bacteriophage HK97-gp10, putative tail-component